MLVLGRERPLVLLVKEDPEADPEACRKRVVRALRKLPKPANDGAADSKAAVQRAWIAARCQSCRACLPR